MLLLLLRWPVVQQMVFQKAFGMNLVSLKFLVWMLPAEVDLAVAGPKLKQAFLDMQFVKFVVWMLLVKEGMPVAGRRRLKEMVSSNLFLGFHIEMAKVQVQEVEVRRCHPHHHRTTRRRTRCSSQPRFVPLMALHTRSAQSVPSAGVRHAGGPDRLPVGSSGRWCVTGQRSSRSSRGMLPGSNWCTP